MSLYFILFAAGVLTILLPCILPLVPIVLGASVAGRSRWRPLVITAGMVTSFVGFTFLLVVVLTKFVVAADYIRIATYYILLLFGVGFLTSRKSIQSIGAVAGAFFFVQKSMFAVPIAAITGLLLLYVAAEIATALQRLGTKAQQTATEEFGQESLFSAAIIGLTLGFVWVPCAGPALGFAFALVREQPGLQAFFALTCYGLGAALPLLLLGYGGQALVHSFRSLGAYSAHIKRASGMVLVLSALALQYHWFRSIETWLVQNTTYGTLGTRIEEQFFADTLSRMPVAHDDVYEEPTAAIQQSSIQSSLASSPSSGLPIIVPAPEFVGLGPWLGSETLSLASLRGKVVLVDIWTYSCINCIRTVPHIQSWWEKFGPDNFVVIGVHTPEFAFEKDVDNVQEAMRRLGITFPVALDNDYDTWKAFNNRYWPALYLLDVDGNIRYMHFGEGKYEETEAAIAALLKEAAVDMPTQTGSSVSTDITPLSRTEILLGAKYWSALGNALGLPDAETHTYTLPTIRDKKKYYLGGNWQMRDSERQVLESNEGEIAFSFTGSEVDIILGKEDDSPVDYIQATVFIDGVQTKKFTFSFHNVYSLYKGESGEHDVVLRLKGTGVAAYSLMFGG